MRGYAVSATACAILTIWYYYERNPNHRPGFPIGNPGPLAAFLVPAILTSIAAGAQALGLRANAAPGEGNEPGDRVAGWLGLGALVPLCWAFSLASARSAQVGLMVGVALLAVAGGIYVVGVGRRGRILLVGGVVAVFAAGATWYISRRDDFGETREATLRFRLYMWRYVAESWSMRPISGMGAASFARLCGRYSARDRAMDPAAFFGEWDGHAHNELFEVLAEIGLLGGVTFVGGFVATGTAAMTLLRSRGKGREGWLLAALTASLAALLADSMFNVSFRLPGVPAAFFTLLGLLWAMCRVSESEEAGGLSRTIEMVAGPRRRRRRVALSVIAGCGALTAFGYGLRNWSGVLHEKAAQDEFEACRYGATMEHAALAESRLLDPLRKLYAGVQRVRAHFELARAAFEDARALVTVASATPGTTNPSASGVRSGPAGIEAAVVAARSVYEEAARMHARAPSLAGMPAVMARAAEMLFELHRGDPPAAREWIQAAHAAWSEQHEYSRYDVESALALTRYPLPIDRHIALMCEALRSGRAVPEWRDRLSWLAGQPSFEATLARFLIQAQPMDPKTDPEALVLSMAPEVFRCAAAYARLRGGFVDASRSVERAVALYRPLKSRFPELVAVALSEQAEYRFRAAPHNPGESIRLIEEAIRELPAIQEQQFDQLAYAYRKDLVFYLLAAAEPGVVAAERSAEAVECVGRAEWLLKQMLGPQTDLNRAVADSYVMLAEMFIPDPPASRPPLDGWLRAALARDAAHTRAWSWMAYLAAEAGDVDQARTILKAAGAAGVPRSAIDQMIDALIQRFPAIAPQATTQP